MKDARDRCVFLLECKDIATNRDMAPLYEIYCIIISTALHNIAIIYFGFLNPYWLVILLFYMSCKDIVIFLQHRNNFDFFLSVCPHVRPVVRSF